MSKKTYDVTVRRVEYRTHTFRVQAKGRDKAFEKAMEVAGNYNFLDGSVAEAGEEIVECVEVRNEKV